MNSFKTAIARLTHCPCPGVRAIHYNFTFDEGLPPERTDPYRRAFQPDAKHFLRSINRHHRRYLEEQVSPPAGSADIPETFDPAKNTLSLVAPPNEDQDLVRVETLDWILDDKPNPVGPSRVELMKHIDSLSLPLDKRPATSVAFLNTLMAFWNRQRDQRPMFAAFASEVSDDIKDEAWLVRLRARLGLGHITPRKNRPIIAALMRYSVKDVLKATPKSERDACFAVPTVLDGPLNPYFYPAPSTIRYGRALNLHADPHCERLTAEVLHRRIDYQPDHLIKVIEVKSVDPAIDLVERRNGHLRCLRRHPGCEGFGEEMV